MSKEIMFRDILLNEIKSDPEQPRTYFNETKLRELADSIQENGLASPILVRPYEDGFMIVHGERRFRAFQLLKLDAIPSQIKEMTEEEARRISVVENVQRDDLSPIEEARAYKKLLSNMTQHELARTIGKDQSYIAHKLRLLKFHKPLMNLMNKDMLSLGHAKVLMKLDKFYKGVTERFTNNDKWTLDGVDIDSLNHEKCILYANELRPEDRPLHMGEGDNQAIFDETVKLMLYNTKGSPLIYERTSTWFGLLAMSFDLSVVELNNAVDAFIDRLKSNIFYVSFLASRYERTAETKKYKDYNFIDRINMNHWYGAKADLRHGGMTEDTIKLFIKDAHACLSDGGISYPSPMQSPNDELKADMIKENERIARMNHNEDMS